MRTATLSAQVLTADRPGYDAASQHSLTLPVVTRTGPAALRVDVLGPADGRLPTGSTPPLAVRLCRDAERNPPDLS